MTIRDLVTLQLEIDKDSPDNGSGSGTAEPNQAKLDEFCLFNQAKMYGNDLFFY